MFLWSYVLFNYIYLFPPKSMLAEKWLFKPMFNLTASVILFCY